jgi:hypothetical protein
VANFRSWHARNRNSPENLMISPSDKGGKFPVPSEMQRSNHKLILEENENNKHLNWINKKPIELELKTIKSSSQNSIITICMATYPGRFGVIKRAVESLLDQSMPPNKILIHVNESDEIPPLPNDSRIIVSGSADENITDIGKFKLATQITEGIILTVDDDIHYPQNYIETLVNAVRRYDGEAIVGVHGCVLPVGEPVSDWTEYRNNRRVHWFRRPVSTDLPVNIVGTGTMAYDASKIKFEWENYDQQRMVDIHVAVEAQEKEWPMITPPRKREWMVPIEPDDGDEAESIWHMVQTDEKMQIDILSKIQQVSEWKINLPGSKSIGKEDLNFLINND